jgi:hypothetical protein
MEKIMNKKKIKKTLESLLQYGWMWGWPRRIDREGWEDLKEFYKEELNNGKDFKPDETKRATEKPY